MANAERERYEKISENGKTGKMETKERRKNEQEEEGGGEKRPRKKKMQ